MQFLRIPPPQALLGLSLQTCWPSFDQNLHVFDFRLLRTIIGTSINMAHSSMANKVVGIRTTVTETEVVNHEATVRTIHVLCNIYQHEILVIRHTIYNIMMSHT